MSETVDHLAVLKAHMDGMHLQKTIKNDVEKLLANPLVELDNWAGDDHFLARGEGWTLYGRFLAITQHSAFSIPHLGAIGVQFGRIEVEEFDLPESFDPETFSESMVLGKVRKHVLSAGETMRINGGRFAYRFSSMEDSYLLRVISPTIHSLQWRFNGDSLAAEDVSAANIQDVTFVNVAKLFAASDDPRCIDAIKSLTQHSTFFVRWAAIQALGQIEPRAAVSALERAVSDEHPEIREAAVAFLNSTLNRHADSPDKAAHREE